MARSSDLGPIRQLARSASGGPELELAPLVQFDPRRRCVICATALIDAAERLVGVGSIDLDHPGAGPDTLLVAGEHAEDVAALLAEALRFRAEQAARARAA